MLARRILFVVLLSIGLLRAAYSAESLRAVRPNSFSRWCWRRAVYDLPLQPRTGESTKLPAAAGDVMQLVAPDTQDWVFLVKAK